MGCGPCGSPKRCDFTCLARTCFSAFGALAVTGVALFCTLVYLVLLEQRQLDARLVELLERPPAASAPPGATLYLQVDSLAAAVEEHEGALAARAHALSEHEAQSISSFEAAYLSRGFLTEAGCPPGEERAVMQLYVFFADPGTSLGAGACYVLHPRGLFEPASSATFGDQMPAGAADASSQGLHRYPASTSALLHAARVQIATRCVDTGFNATTAARLRPEAAAALMDVREDGVKLSLSFSIANAVEADGVRDVNVVTSWETFF